MGAHVAFVPETVKAYVAALGRKVRKEVERCERIISAEGEITLHRARTEAEAALAFARLESLQSARWDGSEEGRYRLDQPAYGRFYRAVLERGSASGFAEVFTLFSGDIPVGAIFGIRNDERFIVLRIASDDARWGRASPGRSTLLAVMEHFVGEGIRTIDLGIGDYAFKRRIGAQPEPLFDLTVPLSWIGTPLAAGLRAKRFLGRQPAFKRFANRVRGRA
jgi:CelD/BcsL family acetyltransferase involved in cellulose biosynthesis